MITGLKNISVIGGQIYHFNFSNQRDLGKTFLRFQEHYESPHFHGKIFSLNEFKTWYKANKQSKRFTYYTDWAGYNFPDYILKPFHTGKFNPLSKDEMEIVSFFKNVTGKFYVIGSVDDNEFSFEHELVHALFYLKPRYRENVKKNISKVNCSTIKQFLLNAGYDKKTLIDEINAYLTTDYEFILGTDAIDQYQSLIDNLQKLYYCERSKII